MKKAKKLFRVATILCVALVLTIVYINCVVIEKTRGRIFSCDSVQELDAEIVLVLGCGLKADGSPSDMLADRVRTAVNLYEQDETLTLLMSGDHKDETYNEVGAMESYAVGLGVDGAAIMCDHKGFSTYESVERAKNEFGAEKIIIVSQKYHLYRALYIADKLGIEAYGVSADLNEYRGQSVRDLREVAARVKDLFLTMFK